MKIDARVTYEGFGRRLLAGLIDMAFVVALAVTVVLSSVAASGSPTSLSTLAADSDVVQTYALCSLLATFAAQVLFWTLLGATPGMLLLGSQVLGAASGRRLPLIRSCVRGAGLWLGLACLGIGVLWIIRDRRRQGLHDKLARSVVVREDESLLDLEELTEGAG